MCLWWSVFLARIFIQSYSISFSLILQIRTMFSIFLKSYLGPYLFFVSCFLSYLKYYSSVLCAMSVFKLSSLSSVFHIFFRISSHKTLLQISSYFHHMSHIILDHMFRGNSTVNTFEDSGVDLNSPFRVSQENIPTQGIMQSYVF